MDGFQLGIEKNPLKTRKDVADAVLQICNPLMKHFSTGGAMLHIGNTGAHFGEKSARMEGFARLLWGLGPLWVHEKETEFLTMYQKGLVSGTDPKSREYWGDIYDFDQKMVEVAAISLTLSIAPEKVWEPLTEDAKSNLYNWMNQINSRQIHKNNWTFFRILVNTCFHLRGLPYDQNQLEMDLEVIDKQYTGAGWYFDGVPGQMDYYIPFAMHFYSLIYGKLMGEKDSKRAEIYRKRAETFAGDFIYWFADDGSEVPFGRSLTYRFAHSAFFSALAFADTEALPWGIIKRVVLQNLRYWFSRPIFDTDGMMTIGYGYPNLIMSERYNSPGSPYWAFKTFLILALDEDHPFWQAEEEAFQLEPKKVLEKPHMLMVREEKSQHIMAFVAGQHCANHGNTAAKYEKFVYSNKLGFSVSRGNMLEDGAFDSALAVSLAGENFYKMKYGSKAFRVEEDYVYSRYEIRTGVEIETYIIPCMPWHVRIHKIHTEMEIEIADGGFAISVQKDFTVQPGNDLGKYKEEDLICSEKELIANFPWGTSGIVNETEGGAVELVKAFPNTNLLSPVTVIPTYKKRLDKGTHFVITSVIGDVSQTAKAHIQKKPIVHRGENQMVIEYDGEKKYIPLI